MFQTRSASYPAAASSQSEASPSPRAAHPVEVSSHIKVPKDLNANGQLKKGSTVYLPCVKCHRWKKCSVEQFGPELFIVNPAIFECTGDDLTVCRHVRSARAGAAVPAQMMECQLCLRPHQVPAHYPGKGDLFCCAFAGVGPCASPLAERRDPVADMEQTALSLRQANPHHEVTLGEYYKASKKMADTLSTASADSNMSSGAAKQKGSSSRAAAAATASTSTKAAPKEKKSTTTTTTKKTEDVLPAKRIATEETKKIKTEEETKLAASVKVKVKRVTIQSPDEEEAIKNTSEVHDVPKTLTASGRRLALRRVNDRRKHKDWICCDRCQSWRRVTKQARKKAEHQTSWFCEMLGDGTSCLDPNDEDYMSDDEINVDGDEVADVQKPKKKAAAAVATTEKKATTKKATESGHKRKREASAEDTAAAAPTATVGAGDVCKVSIPQELLKEALSLM